MKRTSNAAKAIATIAAIIIVFVAIFITGAWKTIATNLLVWLQSLAGITNTFHLF